MKRAAQDFTLATAQLNRLDSVVAQGVAGARS